MWGSNCGRAAGGGRGRKRQPLLELSSPPAVRPPSHVDPHPRPSPHIQPSTTTRSRVLTYSDPAVVHALVLYVAWCSFVVWRGSGWV